jgi:hypothetical protein
MYATSLLPLVLGLTLLMRGSLRLDFRRPRMAALQSP